MRGPVGAIILLEPALRRVASECTAVAEVLTVGARTGPGGGSEELLAVVQAKREWSWSRMPTMLMADS